jgi:uncharacterized Zn-binding protein involved in type VI secretion
MASISQHVRVVVAEAGCRRAVALLALLVAIALPPEAPASASIEYSVKAAYLAKLGIFVEWPRSAFETPQSPVVLCVVGADPFGDTLDKLVEGERVGDRPVVVRRLKTVARSSGCAILFAGGSAEQSAAQALEAVNGTGVLTVADDAQDSRSAAIVDFVVQDGRVRFTINGRAAAQNGINVSSHLLSLAASVKPKP